MYPLVMGIKVLGECVASKSNPPSDKSVSQLGKLSIILHKSQLVQVFPNGKLVKLMKLVKKLEKELHSPAAWNTCTDMHSCLLKETSSSH